MIDRGLERRPRDILVSKRPDGKRPGYGRWDDPGMSPGTSSSGGGRGGPPGGGDRQMTYSAPPVAYSPPPVTTAKAPPSILAREVKAPIHHHTDTIEDVIQQEILDEIRAKEKEQFDKDWEFEDMKVLYGAPKIIKPKPKTYERGVPWLEDELVKTVTPPKVSPTYYQDRSKIGGETWGERAEAGIKRGGIGTTLKNIALGVVAPQLLAGTKLAMPYKMYKGYQTAKKYVPKIGDIETALKNNLTNKYITKKTKTDTQKEATKELVSRDGGEGANIQEAITGGDVITETAKKYASLNDDQINYIRAQLKGKDPEELRGILAQAKSRIESGEANQMEKDVFALVQEYLVDPTQYTAHGGRIDGPLTGGNRYI